jgi:hypothetical protein
MTAASQLSRSLSLGAADVESADGELTANSFVAQKPGKDPTAESVLIVRSKRLGTATGPVSLFPISASLHAGAAEHILVSSDGLSGTFASTSLLAVPTIPPCYRIAACLKKNEFLAYDVELKANVNNRLYIDRALVTQAESDALLQEYRDFGTVWQPTTANVHPKGTTISQSEYDFVVQARPNAIEQEILGPLQEKLAGLMTSDVQRVRPGTWVTKGTVIVEPHQLSRPIPAELAEVLGTAYHPYLRGMTTPRDGEECKEFKNGVCVGAIVANVDKYAVTDAERDTRSGGVPFIRSFLSSGYRNPRRNAYWSKASIYTSNHMWGLAIDIKPTDSDILLPSGWTLNDFRCYLQEAGRLIGAHESQTERMQVPVACTRDADHVHVAMSR